MEEKKNENTGLSLYNPDRFTHEQTTLIDSSDYYPGNMIEIDFVPLVGYVLILAIVCFFGYVIIECLKIIFPEI